MDPRDTFKVKCSTANSSRESCRPMNALRAILAHAGRISIKQPSIHPVKQLHPSSGRLTYSWEAHGCDTAGNGATEVHSLVAHEQQFSLGAGRQGAAIWCLKPGSSLRRSWNRGERGSVDWASGAGDRGEWGSSHQGSARSAPGQRPPVRGREQRYLTHATACVLLVRLHLRGLASRA